MSHFKQFRVYLSESIDHVGNGYLNGLRRYSGVRSFLQVGGQVLIHMLKDQSEFGFSVSSRNCTHIKQPGKRRTSG